MIRRLLSVLGTAALLACIAAAPAYCLSTPHDDQPVPVNNSGHSKTSPVETANYAPAAPAARSTNSTSHSDGVVSAVSPALTPGERLYKESSTAEINDPLNWSVMVYKSRHKLVVYFKGRLLKKYKAVFGRAFSLGPKEWADDRRTPQGVYKIIDKYPSLRFRWFLLLNYPNIVDRERYRRLRLDHDVPRLDGHVLPIGGDVGIHGTNAPVLNRGLINWTTGCISVGNRAISQLARLLPVGTLVIIYR